MSQTRQRYVFMQKGRMVPGCEDRQQAIEIGRHSAVLSQTDVKVLDQDGGVPWPVVAVCSKDGLVEMRK